jgi:hypothetical protein
MNAVAARQVELVDETQIDLVNQARTAALKALREHGAPERLAEGLALAAVHRRALEATPTSIDPSATSVTMNFPSPYPEIRSRIADLLDADDLDGLIRLVPIRDTALRDRVARALRFRNFADYEAAARVQIRKDEILAAEVRALVGLMPS